MSTSIKMDRRSENTLHKIERNNATWTKLWIGRIYVHNNSVGAFNSSSSEEFSRLGAAIGDNTHLSTLIVADDFDNESALIVTNREFFDGLKQNTSIRELGLVCNYHSRSIVGGVFHQILKAYQENNNHLTSIRIARTRLQNGGDDIIANTLRRHTNLKEIYLLKSNMTGAQLLPIVDAIRGGHHHVLEILYLGGNNIGDAGCEAIATLLEDPSCNLRSISLRSNQIGDVGATILANSLSKNVKLQEISLRSNQIGDGGATAIANSLSKNVKLQEISLRSNQIGDGGATAIANSLSGNVKLQKLCLRGNPVNHIGDIFCGVLCNTSCINSTYSSNHTLNDVGLESLGRHLTPLLNMNMGTNKSHVAIKKILKYHPNMDMKPMVVWDAEEGEQNLKALPYVISWFDRAKVTVAAIAEGGDEGDGDSADSDNEVESYNIDGKKLSAIYQFAMAMPTLFEGIAAI